MKDKIELRKYDVNTYIALSKSLAETHAENSLYKTKHLIFFFYNTFGYTKRNRKNDEK